MSHGPSTWRGLPTSPRSGVSEAAPCPKAAHGGLIRASGRGHHWLRCNRAIEREQVLGRLAALGCPVVAWRGPGTVDDVLRRLARRAQLPRVRVR